MEKTYEPHTIEAHWYPIWEQANYFAPQGHNKPYCIMLPPPNVTGSLHMGHGFQHTLMDALTRYHRMCGDSTLWQPGVDHAGIATQMVVERQLLMQNKSRHDVGREAFVERVWEWKAESGNTITQQMRRMGSSVDWSRERFTMDPEFSEGVNHVFIQLYREGLIYRGQRLVNWDPVLHTAISDLEVVTNEENGSLWYLRYPLVNGTGHIVVATTRPETLLGDVAVAVNPNDERYQALIGQEVILPLTGRQIPIVGDDMVEIEFGTGCVKITPAHDFNDYLVGQRHQLPLINIFTNDAALNENAPEIYRGLDRYVAREKIVKDLQSAELIEKIEPYALKVPRGDRSGAVVEPYLTWQWFIKTETLAKPAIEAVEKGEIRFVPENWSKTYFQWMNNIQDWCISRQLWWGHRIPAWFDQSGQVYVGESAAAIRKEHKLSENMVLTQDNDVLDTWFSSALWPFATLGWPEKTAELKQFYPTQVLITGFDIIFFWVARMIMMGLKFTGEVPFKEVYITGLIRDAEGHKMSKSKGNVLDPIDLIDGITLDALVEKRTLGLMQPAMAKKIEQDTRKHYPDGIPAFGTDALRFTFCALASTGRDIRFDLGRVEGYRNFCNKIWNAARYVLMNTEGEQQAIPLQAPTTELKLADRWIRSRLQQTIQQTHHYFSTYRFDLLAQTLYEFTWNTYCDWYLELSKPILTNPDAEQHGTRYTLVYTLETLLRLMHPCMPYITEEIWQRVAPLLNMGLGNTGKTIMLQPYPIYNVDWIDNDAEQEIAWLQAIILGIRNIRGEMNISPGKRLSVLLRNSTPEDQQRLERNQAYLASLAKLDSIRCLAIDETAPPAATALAGQIEILIPLAGLIDVKAEQARLNKEIEKLNQELHRTQQKLENPSYTNKAPADVVNKDRQRVLEIQGAVAQLGEQLERISLL
jgi:valyl-tRNA synthetase